MRHEKRFLIILLLVSLLIVGCGTGTEPVGEVEEPVAEEVDVEEPSTEEEEEVEAPVVEEPLMVAAVLPSTTEDLGWSQSLVDGLREVQQELGGEEAMQLAFTENMWNPVDAEAALRDYAASGYDIVFAHGSGWESFVPAVAADFPDVTFAWGTGTDTFGLPNVFAYRALAYEGGYVIGVMAATLSETGAIGAVGAVDAGGAHLYLGGFEKGILDTNPDATPLISFTGDWNDITLATQAAETLVDAGVDVMTGTSQIMVGSIAVAQENGVLWFGNEVDCTSLAPDIVVAGLIDDYSVIVRNILEERANGVYGGLWYDLTLENGGLRILFNESFDVPDEVLAAGEAAIQGIIDGTIDPTFE